MLGLQCFDCFDVRVTSNLRLTDCFGFIRRAYLREEIHNCVGVKFGGPIQAAVTAVATAEGIRTVNAANQSSIRSLENLCGGYKAKQLFPQDIETLFREKPVSPKTDAGDLARSCQAAPFGRWGPISSPPPGQIAVLLGQMSYSGQGSRNSFQASRIVFKQSKFQVDPPRCSQWCGSEAQSDCSDRFLKTKHSVSGRIM